MCPIFRVVQITDTHVPADARDETVLEMLCAVQTVDPVVNLQIILDDIRALDPAPEFVIATGDLADRGHPASYHRLRALLEPLEVPVYASPGNHDLAEELSRHLPGGNVSVVDAVEHDGWQFVFADAGNTEWGELSPEQVADLDRVMARRDVDNVFLCIHHPPVSVHAVLPPPQFLIDDLTPLLRVHPVRAIASGHVHAVADLDLDGVPVHTGPSTYLGAPGPGYRVFDFDGDTYETHAPTFPLFTMTDDQRQLLIEASRRRAREHAAPVRGHQAEARSVIVDWRANTASILTDRPQTKE
jgi:3',5'-cyclic AMP phosphodiesterase CpdA